MAESEWMTTAEAVVLCKASESSLVGWRRKREFPAPYGMKPKLYRRAEVLDWLKVNRPWVLGK